jgi:hypothetical protein
MRRTLTEDEAVNLILKNIDGWMGMLLGVTKVNTFKDLLRSVSNMERMSPHTALSFMSNRPQRGARVEAKVAFTSLKEKMVANADTQNGNSGTSGNNYNKGPRPNPGGGSRGFETLKQKKTKPYSFRKDKVAQIFRGALKNGLTLPVSKRPEDADKSDEPNFCPYHRVLGHSIEDCWVFKDWVEKAYKNGEITLPKWFLQNPSAHEQANTISHEEEESPDQLNENPEEQWTTHLSKQSIKMLKALKKKPGMKWKDDITPVVSPKPRVYYKVDQSQDQVLKKRKKHRSNGSRKNKIEECEQGSPEVITLQHFISKKDWKKLTLSQKKEDTDEGVNKEESEEIWGASCNTVYSSHDEDMPTLEEMFFLNDEGEASTSGTKGEECKTVLRSGTYVPERQAPKDSDRGKDKAQNKGKEVEGLGKNLGKTQSTGEEYNVLAHLRKIPALLSIFDALMMSQDLREVLILALQNPEMYKSYFIEQNMQETLFTSKRAACINFTNDDLLIGTADHNRPLYITGDCGGQKIGRILVDAGSSINIMPLKTLKTITLDVKNLSDERVIIHGFNQNSKKAMGAITLNLQCGSLKAPTKFYVIDAETSYRALLGRPWLHSNQVIPSTLHQCLKYIENGKQKRIDGDVKPFGVHEIKFNDAQYFLPKTATAPSRSARKAGQEPFNEGPKFDASSGEEEEVKFNFKPRSARAQRPGRKSGEEVAFHFKQVVHLKSERSRAKSIQVILRKRSFSTSSSSIHLESKLQRQLQEKTLKSPTTRATSPQKKRLVMVVNPGKKNLTRRSSITSSRSNTKGLKQIMRVRSHS